MLLGGGFFFFLISMLWQLADSGKDCPSQGNLIPRISKEFCLKHAFHVQTNQPEAHTPQLPPSWGSLLPGHCLSALITLRPGTRWLGTTPGPRGCGSYSNQPILNLLSLLTRPWSFLPRETTIKALAYLFTLLPLPPGWHWCFPT